MRGILSMFFTVVTIGFVNDSITVDEIELSAVLTVSVKGIQTRGVIIVSVYSMDKSALRMLSFGGKIIINIITQVIILILFTHSPVIFIQVRVTILGSM